MFKLRSGAINNGKVRNPNSLIPTLCGIGYMGIGKFNSDYVYYSVWHHMMQRCYDKITQLNQPTYIGCSVDPIWHNFQNFCEWCEDPINGYIEGFDLEKDILLKGNKVYGPETCCLVPNEINILFIKKDLKRGNLPIGVSLSGKKFKTQLSINGIVKYLGTFNTIQEAFGCYKFNKEKLIKQKTDIHKHHITEKVYQALYNYQVEITD
jgi:hypothetical protein